MNGHTPRATPRLFDANQPPSLQEFQELCSQKTDTQTYPLAASVQQNIPVYDLSDSAQPDAATAAQLQDEWYHILYAGPGVFVLKGMYSPQRYQHVLEAANVAFQQIVDREKGAAKGDHFAAGGKNDRIWNAFSKHGLVDPASFVEYYANPWLALVCEAWLGPRYRVTAQVNVVKPGGAAQDSHRDYHIGFQTADQCAQWPMSMQVASQLLTLQGAVAHSDMPVESGPTRLLPFSQRFAPGFMAYRREEFQQYFLDNYVALPLAMGDGIFFNPALFHAAGANLTADFNRRANLLQISSAFGKPMESVEAAPLVDRCWDVLLPKYEREGFSSQVSSFVSALADGYPFPTNLDKRPPAPSGMAPDSEQEIINRALQEGWTREKVVEELRQMKVDSQP